MHSLRVFATELGFEIRFPDFSRISFGGVVNSYHFFRNQGLVGILSAVAAFLLLRDSLHFTFTCSCFSFFPYHLAHPSSLRFLPYSCPQVDT